MTHEYSGESTYNQNVCVRFQKHINSIAVDRSGEHCVLGGKKSLYVIKLEDPNELAKTISNPSSKWDIGIIEWNPHAAKSTLIASAANQEAHIWDSGEGRLVTTIPPHQRAVSDIGWSPSEPNVLVTSSLDSYINLWDVRDPNRALSMKRFSKYNGAVQAKWNRKNSAILASAHDGMILIWDIRKEGQPIASITAHNTQIYGIDWSYLNPNEIISCSQDKMVKLWSIDNPRECKMVLQTGTPVLRAKFLPFGTGIVTVAERGNYILRLWSIKDPSTPPTAPIHAFVGHSDGIRSFDWRISRPKEDVQRLDAIQMLSWSKDQSLRFWCFDNSHLAACGIYATPQPSHRRGSVYFYGDLPPDSPTVVPQYPHLAYGVNSPAFEVGTKYSAVGEKAANTSATLLGNAAHMMPNYMADSLGDIYFGGMQDLLGEGRSDEGEEFRSSLAHLQNKFDPDSREERMDGERSPDELRSTDEKIVSDSSKLELGGMNNYSPYFDRRGMPQEDQGLIPGDLEHEFVLLKKKKFSGIHIVQANAGQRTLIVHVDDGDQQHDRRFQLKITFPSLYPHNASPSFVISDIDTSITATPTPRGTTTPSKSNSGIIATTPPNFSAVVAKPAASPISPAASRANSKFLENLKRVAELRVSHNMPCIESCLVRLVAMLREDERMSQVSNQIRQKTSPNTSPIPAAETSPRPDELRETLSTNTSPTPTSQILAPSNSLIPAPLSIPIADSITRTASPALTLNPRASTPTSLRPPTIVDGPIAPPRTLSAPTPLNRSITPPLPSLPHITSESTSDKGPDVPQIQVVAAKAGDQDSDANGTAEGGEHSPTDPSTKVVRSKSTVELRSTLSVNVTPGLEAPVSPLPSPRPTTPIMSDTSPNASPTQPATTSEASTPMRRSRSAGYDRLSARYAESVAMHIPSPRICGVAISPTGKLIYFQTLHCKNPILPNVPSPQQPTTSNPEPSTNDPTTEQSKSNAPGLINVSQAVTVHSPNSEKSPRKSTRSRAASKSDSSPNTSPRRIVDSGYVTEEMMEKEGPREPKSPEDGTKDTKDTIKDKLKYKLKDLLKDKLKYKIGKPKTKSPPPNPEGFIGEFNLATFKVRNPLDDRIQAEDAASREEEEEYEDTGCSESEYMSDDSDLDESTDNGSEGGDEDAKQTDPRITNNKTQTTNYTINSILNKDTNPGNNLTLPFFGVFPRTYPELTTVMQGSKVANQFTTSDTVVLAQLKSLNSLRVSTKMYITDISHLMPTNIHLAANYRLLGNLLDVCDHNQAAARKMQRLDLVKVWRTLYVLCNPIVYNRPHTTPNFSGSSVPSIAQFKDSWVALPIARNLVSTMFKHYEAICDVQTLAMMSSVLLQSKLNLRTARLRHVSTEEENEMSLLDPAKEPSAHAYRHVYGEMLNKWGLLVKRAELLKHTYNNHPRAHSHSPGASYFPPAHRGITFSVICSSCDQGLKDNFFCSSCKTFGFKCAICNLSVKGLSNFCILCGHGGHAHHMAMWFQRESYCPAGCKCECVFKDGATTPRMQRALPLPHEVPLPSPTATENLSNNIVTNEHNNEPSNTLPHGDHEGTDRHEHTTDTHEANVTREHIHIGPENLLPALFHEAFGSDVESVNSPNLLDAPHSFDDPLPPSSYLPKIPQRSLFPDLLSSNSPRPSLLPNATEEYL